MAMVSEIFFCQVQHPVGQGGFHTGTLFHRISPLLARAVERRSTCFNWAYDCGSDQLSALTAQIQKFSGAHFDLLFLSHLDSDHVVGVDQLLLTVSGVDQLVLPYLGDEDWALHLAAAVSQGKLSGNLIDLAADPAGWLGGRGVARVVYVGTGEPGDEDGAIDGPDRHGPSEPAHENRGDRMSDMEGDLGPMEVNWSLPGRVVEQGDVSNNRAEIALLQQGAVAAVGAAGRQLNWVFSPFAFKPSTAKMDLFKRKLVDHFGGGLTKKEYAEAARTPAGRKGLRACYDAVWKTHNLHSMVLYAGPSTPRYGKLRNTAWCGGFVRRMIQPGWISTGDFDASVSRRRNALLSYYSCYASMVGQLALPHHGSDLSFNEALIDAFPDLSCAVAAVGVNSHGHPGLGVQAAVAARDGLDFVRVDEFASSAYAVRGPVPQ